jgi:hypothetical protein
MVKPTDMTIHWKALEEHCLMDFPNFSQKSSVLKELKERRQKLDRVQTLSIKQF